MVYKYLWNENISGIYEIKNTLNGHRYIGSTLNMYNRFMLHKSYLEHNKHHSKYLQRSWNKYGKNHFEFNILEICEPIKDTLLYIEQKYLDLNPEYNICKNARNCMGCKRTKESNIKNRESHLGKRIKYKSEESLRLLRERQSISALKSKRVQNMKKPILMLDKRTGNIIKEFSSSIEAALFLGRRNKQSNISAAAIGNRKSAFGYKWKFK